MQHTKLVGLVTTVLPASLINDLARDLGALTRQRKIWLAPLVWCLVLGSLNAPHGSLANFHRLYCVHLGARLARSSFYERLTPALTALMSALLKRALRANRRSLAHWMCEPTEFDDVLAVDSSVIALRDGLRQSYEACTKAGAALKVHGIFSVLDFQAHRLRLSAQTDHDLLGLRAIRRWCRGKLLLMDLGYYSFAVFDEICAHGGFFVSRAKSGCAARIVKDYASGSGAHASIVGLKLKQALKRCKRKVIDVDVELAFTRNGKPHIRVVRAVGLWNEEKGRYHVYLTNLDRERYPAQEIGQLYRMRWQIELAWKHLKSDGGMDRQTSGKEHIVQLRLDSVLLAYCITGRLCAQAQRQNRDRPYPVSRGIRALGRLSERLLGLLCQPWASQRTMWSLFEQMTRDPNEFRERATDPLVRTSEWQYTA